MPAPPLRTAISGTPTRATANTGFGALWDYVTGLLGASGNASDARTALGVVAASTSTAGLAELATSAEAIAGTDATRVLTPSTLKSAQIVRGTAIATTSGTFVEFTGIPSWAQRIIVIFNSVSTNGTDNLMIQLGGGSLVTSGYLGNSASGSTTVSITNGFVFTVSISAASTINGHAILTLSSGNVWVQSHTIGGNVGNITSNGGGVVTLGGALDRVRIATTGANTFDAGTVNISWE